MKRLSLGLLAVLTISGVSSCDFLHMFDKLQNFCYISNSLDKDVEISCSFDYDGLYNFKVPAGGQVEVPDIFCWDIRVKGVNDRDTVFFKFSDGTGFIHTSECTAGPGGHERISYSPSENNILYHDMLDDGAWVKGSKGHNKVTYTYTIRPAQL